MRTIALQAGADFAGWRHAARELLAQGVPPEDITWLTSGEASLLLDPVAPSAVAPTAPTARIPAALMQLLESLICHSDPQRYGLAYRLLWRVAQGERQLLQLITDADVSRAMAAAKNVQRDSHKMKAFVRFREVQADDGAPVYVAWFEPTHYVLERVAPFFVRRFTGMRWSILTPYRSAHWDGSTLHFGPGAARADAPQADVLEDYWRTYFASIFNPARLKEQAMLSEMPVKYWKNLPEARLIPQLIREARPRTLAMVQAEATTPRKRLAGPAPTPLAALPSGSLAELRRAARDCRRCPLWEPATQTVFGEGAAPAALMLITEAPSDRDDLAGRPFAGPAGAVMDAALQAVGLRREAVYCTALVKHYKFVARNIFRQALPTTAAEQAACLPWLTAEIARVAPQVIVCVGEGAAAALAVPGVVPAHIPRFAVAHPEALMQLKDEAARARGVAQLVAGLQAAVAAVQALGAPPHHKAR